MDGETLRSANADSEIVGSNRSVGEMNGFQKLWRRLCIKACFCPLCYVKIWAGLSKHKSKWKCIEIGYLRNAMWLKKGQDKNEWLLRNRDKIQMWVIRRKINKLKLFGQGDTERKSMRTELQSKFLQDEHAERLRKLIKSSKSGENVTK